jgi:hypothetical protein
MGKSSRWKWVVTILLFAAAILLGLFSYPAPNQALTDLHNIEELKVRFNQDRGMTRLMLLISPT